LDLFQNVTGDWLFEAHRSYFHFLTSTCR